MPAVPLAMLRGWWQRRGWRWRPRSAVVLGALVLAAATVVLIRPPASSGPTGADPGSGSPAPDCHAAQSSFRRNWDRSQQLDQQWQRLQAEYGPGAAESEGTNTEFVRARVAAAQVVVAQPSCFGGQAVQDARTFLGARGGTAGR